MNQYLADALKFKNNFYEEGDFLAGRLCRIVIRNTFIAEANSLASWVTAKLLGCANDATNWKDIVVVEGVIECMRSKTWEEVGHLLMVEKEYIIALQKAPVQMPTVLIRSADNAHLCILGS